MEDTLQIAHDWLKAATSSLTIHFWKGDVVLGKTNAGSRVWDDGSRKTDKEAIHDEEIQKQAKVKRS